MIDLAQPEAHQPWCADRFKLRSEDHLTSMGSDVCLSDSVQVGATSIFLVEGDDGIVVIFDDDKEMLLTEVSSQLAAVTAAVATLAAAQ